MDEEKIIRLYLKEQLDSIGFITVSDYGKYIRKYLKTLKSSDKQISELDWDNLTKWIEHLRKDAARKISQTETVVVGFFDFCSNHNIEIKGQPHRKSIYFNGKRKRGDKSETRKNTPH